MEELRQVLKGELHEQWDRTEPTVRTRAQLDNQLTALPEAIGNLPLHTLELSGNQLSEEATSRSRPTAERDDGP
jgi:hypothetical protein